MKLDDVVIGESYKIVGNKANSGIRHGFELGQEVVISRIDHSDKEQPLAAKDVNGYHWWINKADIEPIDLTSVTDKLKQIRRDVLNGHDKLDNPFLEGLKRAYELGKESR